jgi:YggT family protein
LTWNAVAGGVELVARLLTLGVVAAATVVALTHWAVRRRHLSAFSPLPRLVRRTSDPIVKPLEARLVRWGRNPQDATLWLLGFAVGAGILLLSLTSWLTGWIGEVLWLRTAGVSAWAHFVVNSVTQVLMLAILVRVIGSWLGYGPYTRWIRPAYVLTDWLVEPIRRRLPTLGPIDLSPIVAYFALFVLRGLLVLLIP